MVWTSPCKPWEECNVAERAALRFCWTHGDLTYKLDPDQLETYNEIKSFFSKCNNSFERIWVNEWSRRLGKDFLTWVILRGASRVMRNDIFYYGTAYETDINDILIPIIDEVEKDCPPELRIKAKQSKGHYVDESTNTVIRLIGLDKNPNGIRGKRAGMIAITEVAYVAKIDEAETAYKPMLTENPSASRIYNSTPSESVVHKWQTEIVPKARKAGGYSKRILDDCKRFLPEQIEAAYDEFGGRDSTKSMREYRCEHVSEETKMVVPEWTKHKDACTVDSYPRPAHAIGGMATDPGQVHLHANVYGYYDFEADIIVVTCAGTMKNPKTSEIATQIKHDESEIWKGFTYHDENTKEFRLNPFFRVSDTDLRLIKDLSEDYDLMFEPTRKDDLRSAVNALRTRIQDERYRILPDAFELTLHLDGAIWDKSGKKFEYVSPVLGHFDLLAALVYLNRYFENYVIHRNPLPPKSPPKDEFRTRVEKKKNFGLERGRYGNIIEKNPTETPLINDIWK